MCSAFVPGARGPDGLNLVSGLGASSVAIEAPAP